MRDARIAAPGVPSHLLRRLHPERVEALDVGRGGAAGLGVWSGHGAPFQKFGNVTYEILGHKSALGYIRHTRVTP